LSHSKMLHTRRKKQRIRKLMANAAKREKRLAKQAAKAAREAAPPPSAPAQS
jgi:hypothetical protein